MVFSVSCLHSIRRYITAILFVCVASSVTAQTQQTSVSGNILYVPVVISGDSFYSFELTIFLDTDPIQLELTNSVEIFDVDSDGASILAGSVLSIPSLIVDETDYWLDLVLIGEDPLLFALSAYGVIQSTADNNAAALKLFEETIFPDIIQPRCIVCHVPGGVADGQTILLYESGGSSAIENNFSLWESFAASRSDAKEYALEKVIGGEGHTGGAVLPKGGSEYNYLVEFLSLLTSTSSETQITNNDNSFFGGIQYQSNLTTLRKSAIRFAGRLPTDEENAQVAAGNNTDLRQVIKNMLQGDAFHNFLKDAANDRLLVRGALFNIAHFLLNCPHCYPEFARQFGETEQLNEGPPLTRFHSLIDYALLESPLELIAHVVENELPYSEILTADYMMLTPPLNTIFESNASFNDPSNSYEFQPGNMYVYRQDDSVILDQIESQIAPVVVDPGNLKTEVPLAGVLNSLAFLGRYPTTETNRNRARSRWTQYHFLDFDIERSAQRTTDPAALADANNPTMNNPNCTVCHARMDPVGGTFKFYGPEGRYKESFGGLDSLPYKYKYPGDGEVHLYQDGDTWFRDMRDPGFQQKLTPDSAHPLQWLADQIVLEPAFATAAVKFWWPAVIGSEVLLPPTNSDDQDYAAHLLAYDAQNETISELADSFLASGMNGKELLLDLIMSPWFRNQSIDEASLNETTLAAHGIADLGNEKLLTPEQLQTKTTALTGFTWNNQYDYAQDSNINTLSSDAKYDLLDALGQLPTYTIYYGGIDSMAVTVRTREMTPMMATVPMAHALQSACPIVLREFILPDESRKLFYGIDEFTTPLNGEQQIKQKLVDLHSIMLGSEFSINSPEIISVYELFTDSWNERQNNAAIGSSLINSTDQCDFWRDIEFSEGLGYSGEAVETLTWPNMEQVKQNTVEFIDWVHAQAQDPTYAKQSWTVVMVYLLTHYDYLFE